MGIERVVQNRQRLIDTLKRKGEVGRPTEGRPRVPRGQRVTSGFPTLDLGIRPDFDPATWRLQVTGEVASPRHFTWEEFQQLPRVEQVSDFHCVTTWSKLDVRWSGVRMRTIAELVKPTPQARFVIAQSGEGYATNLPLDEALAEDVLLACELEGQPLPIDHGGPLRLVVPKLYGWKSAKFLRALRFSVDDEPGFWEQRGYHYRGDPWREERFG